jgi:siroheme synthase-like protein
VTGYFPVNWSLAGRACLVVGGGKVALRKVRGLLAYGGQVTVVAPNVCSELAAMVQAGSVTLIGREYGANDAVAFGLVISAVDSADVNRQVYEDCRAAGVPVNVVDDPEHCDFILPSTVRRGPLTISVGTQGTAPFFARWVRERMEELVPEHWEDVAELAGEFRKRVLAKKALSPADKNDLFARFCRTDWKAVIEAGGRTRAAETMDRILNRSEGDAGAE